MAKPDQKHMKDEEILEYHPNGRLKYILKFHDNGSKCYERFYNEIGAFHREDDLPALQEWHMNGILYRKVYLIHGIWHHICNPAEICFRSNGKIKEKYYFINDRSFNKLYWQNNIKNI